MFGLFKKKSEAELLQKRYNKLMAECHRLSTINRKESDKKYAEAEAVARRIDSIKRSTA